MYIYISWSYIYYLDSVACTSKCITIRQNQTWFYHQQWTSQSSRNMRIVILIDTPTLNTTISLLWQNKCHKPTMTGAGWNPTCKNNDFGGGLALVLPHSQWFRYTVPIVGLVEGNVLTRNHVFTLKISKLSWGFPQISPQNQLQDCLNRRDADTEILSAEVFKLCGFLIQFYGVPELNCTTSHLIHPSLLLSPAPPQ